MNVQLSGRLSRSRRGVTVIAGGTALGQIATLACTPFLTRLFSPSEFGLFALVSSVAMIVGAVAAFRYEMAIPTLENDADAYGIAAAGILCSVGVGGAGALIFFLGGANWLADRLGSPQVGNWLPLASFIGGTMGVNLVLSQLAVRQRRYGASGRRALTQSLATVGGQLGLGAAGAGLGGLSTAFLGGQLVSMAVLGRGSGLHPNRIRRSSLWPLAKSNRRYPLLLGPSALLNAAGLQIPVLLVAHFYGALPTGWLSMTQRVITIPLILVSAAVSQVFAGELAEAMRTNAKGAEELFRSATLRLLPLALVVATITAVASPFAFGVVLGSEWTKSGHYAQALAMSLGAQLVAVPLSQTLILVGRPGRQLAWDAVRLAVTFLAIAVSFEIGASDTGAIWALGCTSASLYLVNWLMSRRALAEWSRAHDA